MWGSRGGMVPCVSPVLILVLEQLTLNGEVELSSIRKSSKSSGEILLCMLCHDFDDGESTIAEATKRCDSKRNERRAEVGDELFVVFVLSFLCCFEGRMRVLKAFSKVGFCQGVGDGEVSNDAV